MKKKAFIIILLILSFFACSKKDTEQKDRYIAKVGNTKIKHSELEREFNALPDYAKQMFEDAGGKRRLLDEIIKKELIYQDAIKKGIAKSPDVKRKIEEFRKITVITELFEKEIVSKAKVSDQEVRDFYDRNKGEFVSAAQIKASHILVETEKEANKILARLEKGEKFQDIAKAVSIDKATAENGGDLGYLSKGQMVPEFERAAFGLKAGETSKPVKTQYGYHIIKVVDRKGGSVIEFERVSDMISQKLLGDKQKELFDNYVDKLKKQYKIEIYKDAFADSSEDTGKTEKQPPASPEKDKQPKEPTKKDAK